MNENIVFGKNFKWIKSLMNENIVVREGFKWSFIQQFVTFNVLIMSMIHDVL